MTNQIKPDTPIEKISRLNPFQKKALIKMKLKSARDLLHYFPARYGEAGLIKTIEYLIAGEQVIVFGKISKLKTSKTYRTRVAISSAELEDATGKIKIVWFNQPYIAKMYAEGSLVRLEGRVSQKKSNQESYFSNPKIEKVKELPEGTSESLFGDNRSNLTPVYRESRGLTSNWIYHTLQKIIKTGLLEKIEDPVPSKILKKYNLPPLKTALIWVHFPRKKEDAEVARKRFAFEEIFFIQLDRQREKYITQKEKAFVISKSNKEIVQFTKTFPFLMTRAQKNSVEVILEDFKKGYPMSRLLEGDVGSGKTAVAVTAAYAVAMSRPFDSNQGRLQTYGSLQTAYMAPTEILANQHFESFIEYFAKYKISVGLITSSGAKKFPSKSDRNNWTNISKSQLLKWVANGEIPILIGTHSLIQKTVKFQNLAFIIIDEQHRFGVKQRMQLRRKHDIAPHLLSMTATPIPRTLALTLFGDLDLSLLDELPAGRQLPETKIVLPHEREAVYKKIREELETGRQAFVICPRINDPDPDKETAINARSVKSEAERLQKEIFPDFKVRTVTGKLKPKEKEEVMNNFKDGKTHILVATSVVEVGVNIPNATVIIIENAERFGLAQLHQLRGRILRSSHKPYCFVFANTKSPKTITRLKSFVNAKNGFELAEKDLQQRGAGDLAGAKQWGISDLAMEALKNIKMVEAARTETSNIISQDFELKKYPQLAKNLSTKSLTHME
ncbi:MAG: ATP-dependent DNA helicase RecG [Candidatus Zambryskibacteria bacterium]|nr:ATP-dependent DNA helicase RecG [Candidatus Zambryskibacteria bacterium]